MLRLKEFIQKKLKSDKLSDKKAYVPIEPVHFKGSTRKTGKKKTASNIKEDDDSQLPHLSDMPTNLNRRLGETPRLVSLKLFKNLERTNPLNKDEIEHLRKYTADSSVNHDLVGAHHSGNPLPTKYDEHIKHLDSATGRRIGKEIHLYSGLGFNPGRVLDADGHLHLPAYTSTTHDTNTALRFARPLNTEGESHILHIHAGADDKGVNVENITDNDEEHETVLPRNTRLQVHPVPTIYRHEGGKVHVWHARIVKQD